MKDKKINVIRPVIMALVLMGGILIGIKLEHTAVYKRGLLFFPVSNKMTHAFNLIEKSYVDSVSAGALEENAITGMLKILDPHTQYIPASNFSAVNDPLEGKFSGIGVQFNMLGDTAVILNTIPTGPSEKIGIMAGDRIIQVNDSLVAGVKMQSNDIAKRLKGKTGTKVKVGIRRKENSGLLDFMVTRDKIPLVSIDAAYMITPEIGYIKVNKFSKTTLQEFTDAAAELKTEGMKKLMIDLRENPGGIIDGAIGMSEMFLPAGKLIVYTKGNRQERRNYFSKGNNPEYVDMDLVLLIAESSASASEIFAGAIQDNDRGTIIGRRSYGKGLIQEQYSFSDGSAIRISVSRYYTPVGRCIQKPYKTRDSDNNSQYFNELETRYSHGEMDQADSIRFDDALQFITPEGKEVYGGGGIMPDIFIPIDNSWISKYYEVAKRRGLIYAFAFYQVDKNRKELSRFKDYKSLQAYLYQRNILKEFVAYAATRGLVKNDRDLKISGPVIENMIMAYIARHILDDKGYYPVLNQMDKTVQKGIEVLNNQ